MMNTVTRMIMGEGTTGIKVTGDQYGVMMYMAELNEQVANGFHKKLDFKEDNTVVMEWGDPKEFIEWVGRLQLIAKDIESKLPKQVCECNKCLANDTPFCSGDSCKHKSISQMESLADVLSKHIDNRRCYTCVCSFEPSKAMSMTMPEGSIICNFEGTMPRSVHKNGYCGAYAPKECR